MRTILPMLLLCLLSNPAPAQTDLNNESELVLFKIFKTVEIAIPRDVNKVDNEMLEEMGFVKFQSDAMKVEINFKQQEGKKDLPVLKELADGVSEGLYDGKIFRSEIVKVGKLEIFVHEVKGKWNGTGDVIGIFRYYFVAGRNTYSFVMLYPADAIEKTSDLRSKMIQAVRVIK